MPDDVTSRHPATHRRGCLLQLCTRPSSGLLRTVTHAETLGLDSSEGSLPSLGRNLWKEQQ
ncbi:Hypothetical predicted protein [Podarcis lilfordi]|uniref:Uncharacterized protein n=1 Tax=Podarcis lilfordi TaxID=74358 RepID=A0AA35K9U2_9SAUR|nr:Hypothetical predicted protein [Podarcis lilfordi]